MTQQRFEGRRIGARFLADWDPRRRRAGWARLAARWCAVVLLVCELGMIPSPAMAAPAPGDLANHGGVVDV